MSLKVSVQQLVNFISLEKTLHFSYLGSDVRVVWYQFSRNADTKSDISRVMLRLQFFVELFLAHFRILRYLRFVRFFQNVIVFNG